MLQNNASDRLATSTGMIAGESAADFRQRTKLQQAEAFGRRQQELDEQCSPLHPAADRIRMWERLHQLPLPPSATHRLLEVIAAKTGLSLDEVLAEQRARALAKGLSAR